MNLLVRPNEITLYQKRTMKSKIKLSLILVCFLTLNLTYGQVTIESNTPTGNNQFLGWSDTDDTNLEIKQNNQVRMRFTNIDWEGLNGEDANNVQRTMMYSHGLTPNYTPFSILHLGRPIGSTLYRPWMHVGTTYSSNVDLMYVGLIDRPTADGPNAATDAVVAWGCNDLLNSPDAGPDNFRFLFIASTNGDGPGATEQGREVARFTPEGNYGIGDFSPTGFNQQPTQRLDVDGTARFRDMSESNGHVLITGKQEGAVGDYKLHYKPYSGNADEFLNGEGDWIEVDAGGGDDMDWESDGTNVWTGHGTGGYPGGKVIIGSAAANNNFNFSKFGLEKLISAGENTSIGAKIRHSANATATPFQATGLEVANSAANGSVVRGVLSTSSSREKNFAGFFSADGLDVNAQNYNGVTTGVHSRAHNAKYLFGVDARVNYGKYMYGVRGYAPANVDNSWAIYASGKTFSTTSANWTTSDRRLKKNIQDVENGLDIVMDLQPKTYEMRHDEFPAMNLSSRPQYGLIAQEIQEVLPHSVDEVHIPPVLDEKGEVLTEGTTVKAVDYQVLIPILVAATQEQQALIEKQAAQIEELRGIIRELYSKPAPNHGESAPSDRVASPAGDILHSNTPNPFKNRTTLHYTLAKDGFAELKIYNSTGQIITTLLQEFQNRGDYQVEWNAADQAAGVYYYTLEVNGAELVRKMIKL